MVRVLGSEGGGGRDKCRVRVLELSRNSSMCSKRTITHVKRIKRKNMI